MKDKKKIYKRYKILIVIAVLTAIPIFYASRSGNLKVENRLVGDGSNLTNISVGALDIDLQTLATPEEWRMYYSNGSPAIMGLAFGTSGQVLQSNGVSSVPTWEISSNWHGSATRIKLIPNNFLSDDDSSSTESVWDDINNGMRVLNSANELYTFVAIPTGYKATHARIYCSSTTINVLIFEQDIIGSSQTSKGTGTTGAEIDITDVSSTSTNYLVIEIEVSTTSQYVYGGYVTIAEI